MSEKPTITRAEAVRLRRKDKTQQRAARPSASVGRPLPLITTRQDASLGGAQALVRPHAHRRFQAALALPGFQIRTPSLPALHFEVGWRLLSFFLSLALGIAAYLAWSGPEFRVQNATITGNARLSAGEINQALGVAGDPIFLLVPTDLEKRLRLNFPELSAVNASVELPNRVSVSVVERQPVILWQQNGAYTWIDQNGIAIRPRGTSGASPLIVVAALGTPPPGQPSAADAFSPVPYVSADLIQSIQALAPAVPAGARLTYDPHLGLGWQDGRGWQVYFGSDSSDMPARLAVYKALVGSLLSRGVYPVFISVQYPSAPYYRLSQ